MLVLVLLCAISLPAVSSAQERPDCARCGSAIEGAYFETKGRRYHPAHFTCAHCGDAITDSYMSYQGSNYHNRCFEGHVALRCAVCSGFIQGQYIVDYWGNGYHLEHRKDVASCDFCMRFMTNDLHDGSVNYSDGRTLCRICHKSAVKRVGEARLLMRDVAERLSRCGIIVDITHVQLHLIGQKKMQRLVRKHSYGLRGFTDYQEERGLFGRPNNREAHVYLLYGSPRVEMMATIAHELTHVWQFFNGQLKADRALAEGSCNFASYLVLRMIDDDEARFIIQRMVDDEDPVYGGGFRRVRRYVEGNGLAAWLRMLKSNSDLPQYSSR
jgi:hypothetical protein